MVEIAESRGEQLMDCLMEAEPATQTQLVAASKLSPSTVCILVAKLIQRGLIVCKGRAPKRPGARGAAAKLYVMARTTPALPLPRRRR